MGLVDRLTRNIRRVVSDVAPLAAAGAGVAFPGIGGQIAAAAIRRVIPTASEVSLRRASAAQARVNSCAVPGVAGTSFSAPFQSRFFSEGGSIAGRQFQTTFPPTTGAVGRQVVPPACPSTCPQGCKCPTPGITPAAAAAPLQRSQFVNRPRFGRF